VDTLEKYQDALVDQNSAEGKDFILFKRELYKLYEVRNRSMLEHEAFSFNVERQNLSKMYQANLSYT